MGKKKELTDCHPSSNDARNASCRRCCRPVRRQTKCRQYQPPNRLDTCKLSEYLPFTIETWWLIVTVLRSMLFVTDDGSRKACYVVVVFGCCVVDFRLLILLSFRREDFAVRIGRSYRSLY